MTWKIYPVDQSVLGEEERRIRDSYWFAEERPLVALLAGVLNVCGVAYAEFKVFNGISPFNSNEWISSLAEGIITGFFLGLPVAFLAAAIISKSISGLTRAITGRGMFPMTDRYRSSVDPEGNKVLGCSTLLGIPLGLMFWIIVGP